MGVLHPDEQRLRIGKNCAAQMIGMASHELDFSRFRHG
jgi:hypothetical protein